MSSTSEPDSDSAARPRTRPTIDDVARAAGVSRQTVSNAIRGRGRLGENTRVRVRQAIDQLGYSPHPGASSLRSRRTMQLAHPMPAIELDPGNAIAIEFIQALVTAAGRHDFHVLLAASQGPLAEIEALIQSGRVDAFVFSNLEPQDPRIELVAAQGFPFACFGRTEPGLPQCWVDVDNAAGIRTTTNLLLAKGHADIAYVGYDGDSYWDYERIDGYRAAMAEAGRPVRPVLTRNTPGAIRSAVASLLADADADAGAAGGRVNDDPGSHGRPTAIVTGSDALAAAVYTQAKELGLVIGRDLDVTGFDGSVIGRNLTPRLTTLAIPLAEIADRVIDRVQRELAGPTSAPGQMVPLTLVPGDSA